MIIACIVLSSLALLAAVANIILFVTEKKRRDAKSEKQRIDMLNYVHAECDHIAEATSAQAKEYVNEKVREVASLLTAEADSVGRKVARRFERAEAEIEKLKEEFSTEIEKLKSGLAPDYEKALAAAKAVNDFNTGLSAIMNYDPIAAVRAQRQSGDKEADAWQE